MPRKPRPEMRVLAESIKNAGLLRDLQATATIPEDAPAARARYEIVDNNPVSIEMAVKEVQEDFGITKPIKLPSEDYSLIRKTINRLVVALKQFTASGKQIDPEIGLDFGTGTDRVDSQITPDKKLLMYAGKPSYEILLFLEQAHDKWDATKGEVVQAGVESFDSTKEINRITREYYFINKIEIKHDVSEVDTERSIKILDDVFSDEEIKEIFKRMVPSGVHIKKAGAIDVKSNILIIPSQGITAKDLKDFILTNSDRFTEMGGAPLPPEKDELELPEPEEEFDETVAIEAIKVKYNVSFIEVEAGVPEKELKKLLEKLDEVLAKITDLNDVFPLSIKINNNGSKVTIYSGHLIKIGKDADLEKIAITINGTIEERKIRKTDYAKALVMAAEIKDKYSLAEIYHYKGAGELKIIEELKNILDDEEDTEFLEGVRIVFDSKESIVNLSNKEIKIPFNSTEDKIRESLQEYRMAKVLLEVKMRAIEDARDPNFENIEALEKSELEPVFGRAYADPNGYLYIVASEPAQEPGRFLMLDPQTGVYGLIDTDSFAQKVSSKEWSLAPGTENGVSKERYPRMFGKKEIIGRASHYDYYIAKAQQDIYKLLQDPDKTPAVIGGIIDTQKYLESLSVLKNRFAEEYPENENLVYYRDPKSATPMVLAAAQAQVDRLVNQFNFDHTPSDSTEVETLFAGIQANLQREKDAAESYEERNEKELSSLPQGHPLGIFSAEALAHVTLFLQGIDQRLAGLEAEKQDALGSLKQRLAEERFNQEAENKKREEVREAGFSIFRLRGANKHLQEGSEVMDIAQSQIQDVEKRIGVLEGKQPAKKRGEYKRRLVIIKNNIYGYEKTEGIIRRTTKKIFGGKEIIGGHLETINNLRLQIEALLGDHKDERYILKLDFNQAQALKEQATNLHNEYDKLRLHSLLIEAQRDMEYIQRELRDLENMVGITYEPVVEPPEEKPELESEASEIENIIIQARQLVGQHEQLPKPHDLSAVTGSRAVLKEYILTKSKLDSLAILISRIPITPPEAIDRGKKRHQERLDSFVSAMKEYSRLHKEIQEIIGPSDDQAPLTPLPAPPPSPEPRKPVVPESPEPMVAGSGFEDLEKQLNTSTLERVKRDIKKHLKSLKLGMIDRGVLVAYVGLEARGLSKIGEEVKTANQEIKKVKERYQKLGKNRGRSELNILLRREFELVAEIQEFLVNPTPHFNDSASAHKFFEQVVPNLLSRARDLTRNYQEFNHRFNR